MERTMDVAQPKIAEEIEKKLIGYSLSLGIVLLVVLAVLARVFVSR